MALSVVTPATEEPISLIEAKVHLRVSSNDDDDLIDTLLIAAREYAETFTHRTFVTTTFDLKLDDFPCWSPTNHYRGAISDGAIWLPQAPLVSVTSVSYIDANGTTQTWGTGNYVVDAPVGPKARKGAIYPAYTVPYPVTRLVPNAVTVRFVAGYGAAKDVPFGIKAAMKLLIAHWYDNRAQVIVTEGRATMIDVTDTTLDALLWPFKSF